MSSSSVDNASSRIFFSKNIETDDMSSSPIEFFKKNRALVRALSKWVGGWLGLQRLTSSFYFSFLKKKKKHVFFMCFYFNNFLIYI
jgi:hypothetical protein